MNNDIFGANGFDDIFNDPFFKQALGDSNGRQQMRQQPIQVQERTPQNKKSLLDEYGTDLTQMAKDGKLDPVIGGIKKLNKWKKF